MAMEMKTVRRRRTTISRGRPDDFHGTTANGVADGQYGDFKDLIIRLKE
jgi:hypothetical protein